MQENKIEALISFKNLHSMTSGYKSSLFYFGFSPVLLYPTQVTFLTVLFVYYSHSYLQATFQFPVPALLPLSSLLYQAFKNKFGETEHAVFKEPISSILFLRDLLVGTTVPPPLYFNFCCYLVM